MKGLKLTGGKAKKLGKEDKEEKTRCRQEEKRSSSQEEEKAS